MRRFVTIIALTLAVSGCSDPQDIVLGPEPLKQMAEQGDQFKKLPEEDRLLLAGYLGLTEVGKAFGGEVKPVTGRTVKEVLADARAWREKTLLAAAEIKKQEEEAEALRAKVLAERKAVANKIAASVTVAVVDKVVLPENYDAGRFSGMLVLKYAVQNKSDKTIRQVKGRAIFKDATGDEIGWLPVNLDTPVGAGQAIKTDTGRGWEINEFMNGDIEKIAGKKFSAMTARFEPESLAFEGGEVLKAPELEE